MEKLHEAINRWLKTIALCMSILHSSGIHPAVDVPQTVTTMYVAYATSAHEGQASSSKS